ncbi:MAG: hypothetical protein AB7J13_12455, partial [Pyrinomonadaceae bacterium]
KNFVLAAAITLLATAITVSAQKTPDFGGKWTLDVAKSKLGDRNMIESQTLAVTQTDKDIKIETATKRTAPPAGRGGGGRMGGGGDMAVTYSLDGKETKIERQGPQGAIPVMLKGKFDGGKLHLSQSSTFSGPNGEITMTTKETWELGADGRSLTVTTERTTMRGTDSTTRVFTKG